MLSAREFMEDQNGPKYLYSLPEHIKSPALHTNLLASDTPQPHRKPQSQFSLAVRGKKKELGIKDGGSPGATSYERLSLLRIS